MIGGKISSEWGQNLPWIKQSMKSFVGGVLGRKYESPFCTDDSGNLIRAPSAWSFCFRYANCAAKVFSNEIKYSGVVESFDYFYSALLTGFIPEVTYKARITKMLDLANDFVLSDPGDEDIELFLRQILSKKDEMLEIYSSWPE